MTTRHEIARPPPWTSEQTVRRLLREAAEQCGCAEGPRRWYPNGAPETSVVCPAHERLYYDELWVFHRVTELQAGGGDDGTDV